MPMPMRNVRVVGVRMPQRLMSVPMGVRLGYVTVMLMLVMHVVSMAVLVFDFFMLVPMVVAFGEMQP
jgi:hypothetical protein